MRRLVAVLLLVDAIAACGLEVSGLGGDGVTQASDDASASDDARHGDDASGSGDDGGSPTPCAPPPDWSVAAYRAGTPGCPSGWGIANLVTAPNVAGACSCTCDPDKDITSHASCTSGTAKNFYDNGSGGCYQLGGPMPVSGGCDYDNSWVGADFAGQAVGPSGNPQCVGHVKIDMNKVTATPAAICTPQQPQDVQGACNHSAPNGWKACVVKGGHEKDCPSGWGSQPEYVGTGVNPGCTGCQCTVTPSCGSASVVFYDDHNCSNPSTPTLAMDGTCQSTRDGGAHSGSYIYSSQLTEKCAASGSTAQPLLQNEQTVCCP